MYKTREVNIKDLMKRIKKKLLPRGFNLKKKYV